MKAYYTPNQKAQITQKFNRFQTDKSKLAEISILLQQIAPMTERHSNIFKFAFYGVGRRLRIMEQCITNVFTVRPIETDTIPNDTELFNLMINLHCFLIHLYGLLENLAHIYANAINFQGKKFEISFFHDKKRLLHNLPECIQNKINTPWQKHVKDIRDLLAHQEPFYIPPSIIDKKFEKEWQNLELEKENLRNAFYQQLSTSEYKQKAYNGTIEELVAENQKIDNLRKEFDNHIKNVEQQQLKYQMFIPMIISDTKDLKRPAMQFYPQILVDMETILEITLDVLKHVHKIQNIDK